MLATWLCFITVTIAISPMQWKAVEHECFHHLGLRIQDMKLAILATACMKNILHTVSLFWYECKCDVDQFWFSDEVHF